MNHYPWGHDWFTVTTTDTTTFEPLQPVVRCPTCNGGGEVTKKQDLIICETCLGSGLVRDEGNKVVPVERASADPR